MHFFCVHVDVEHRARRTDAIYRFFIFFKSVQISFRFNVFFSPPQLFSCFWLLSYYWHLYQLTSNRQMHRWKDCRLPSNFFQQEKVKRKTERIVEKTINFQSECRTRTQYRTYTTRTSECVKFCFISYQ